MKYYSLCDAGLYLEINNTKFYSARCTQECTRKGNQDYLDYGRFCKDNCEYGYVTVSNVCQKCPFKCAGECDESLACLGTCKGDRVFEDQCKCPAGTYEDNIRIQCQKCSSQCLNCTTSSDNCIVCGKNRETAPTCNCSLGFFDDQINNDCQKCAPNCKTCIS